MKNCTFVLVMLLSCLLLSSLAHADLFMSVSGKVVAADDGAGLPNIKLVLMSQTKGRLAEARSNAQGVFVLRDVPQGMHEIMVISENPFVVSSSDLIPVTVPDGKNVVGVGIKLKRGGAIRGRLLTDKGLSIPGTQIIANGGEASSKTDEYGNFIVTGLAGGELSFGIVAPGLGVRKYQANCIVGKITELGNIVMSIGPSSSIKGNIADESGNVISDAILVASNNKDSAGYTLSDQNGAFYIEGLVGSNLSLTVIAKDFEPLTISNINIPANGIDVVLVKSNKNTTRVGSDKLLVKTDIYDYFNSIVPAATSGVCSMAKCPEGLWLGASADFTGILSNLGVISEGSGAKGGSFSIGSYVCTSSLARLRVSSFCKYKGISNTIANIGVSFSAIACRACCSEELLGESSGAFTSFYSIGGPRGVAGGLDFSSGATCASLSYGQGLAWPGWFSLVTPDNKIKKLLQGAFIGMRTCDSIEYVDIQKWWANQLL